MKRIVKIASMLLLISCSILFADEALLKQATNGDAEAQYKVAGLYASGKMGDKSLKSKKEMYAWLERAAEQGHVKAMEVLCTKYTELGEDRKAILWAKKAMEKNSEIGKSAMAIMYARGAIGLPMDLPKALEYAKATSSKPLSKVALSMFYSKGYFEIEKDLERAKELANEAIKRNCYLAYDFLASLYVKEYQKNHDPLSLKKARSLLERLKDPFPNEAAIGLLSIDFAEGKEPKTVLANIEPLLNEYTPNSYFFAAAIAAKTGDVKKYAQYMIKAAELGFAKAAFPAWSLVTSGTNGVEVNKEKAKEFLDLAIMSCDPFAITSFCIEPSGLKKIFPDAGLEKIDDKTLKSLIKKGADNGGGMLQSIYAGSYADSQEEKLKYLIEAAKNGVPNSALKATLILFDTDPVSAFNTIKIGVNNQEPDSILLYGRFLLDGIGCERDIQLGLENVELAAVFGNVFAAQRLFNEYFKGDLVEANIEKAYVWGNLTGNPEVISLLDEQLADYSSEEIEKMKKDLVAMRNIINKNSKEYKNKLKEITRILSNGENP